MPFMEEPLRIGGESCAEGPFITGSAYMTPLLWQLVIDNTGLLVGGGSTCSSVCVC